MPSISIVPMTKDLCRQVYEDFVTDYRFFIDQSKVKPFVYVDGWEDTYLEEQNNHKHILFAIMLDDKAIGEIKLYNVSPKKKRCVISINLKRDEYKNKGYGSEALAQILNYIKTELGFLTAEVRIAVNNGRAKRVAKKLGFRIDYVESKCVYCTKKLDDTFVKKPFKIVSMTHDLYHEYYKDFKKDPPLPGSKYREEYEYDQDYTEQSYRLYVALERMMFAVMVDGKPIGEVHIMGVDREEDSCMIDGSIQTPDLRNRGYGSEIILRVFKYIKECIGVKHVTCDVDADEQRAIHFLEKTGFIKKRVDYYGRRHYVYTIAEED